MSVRTLFTDGIEFSKLIIKEYPEQIQRFVQDIWDNDYTSNVEIFKLQEDSIIYIKTDLLIRLPSRGPVDNIAIRETEPILLIIDSKVFPYKAPSVCINRLDFPFSKLPHINYFPEIFPIPTLCLHRGNFDDWFIEHSNVDFINRIRIWYRDAASNNLIKENDEFEPARINYSSGQMIYNEKLILDFVRRWWNTKNNNRGIAFFSCIAKSDNNNNNKRLNIEIKKIVEKNNLHELTNNQGEEELIGILTWPKEEFSSNIYVSNLPKTTKELIDFGNEFDNRIKVGLNMLIDVFNTDIQIDVPVISIVKRPLNLIGQSHNLEFFHFFARVKKSGHLQGFDNKGEVYRFIHSNPLSIDLAKKLSNTCISSQPRIALVGCGALGSKISAHLVKSGYTDISFIDTDTLLPHNLVRHVLYDGIGENKAKALRNRFNSIYDNEPNKRFKYEEDSITSLLTYTPDKLANKDYLLDFTASNSVFNFLASDSNPISYRIIRGEIGYSGQLGVMLVEGQNRSVKIDELRALLFLKALDNEVISNWLNYFKGLMKETNESELEEIIVGLSCSSNTMPLSDDIISSHASIMSYYTKKIMQQNHSDAKIVINYFNIDNPIHNKVFEYSMNEFYTLKSYPDSWEIKIYKSTYERIVEEYSKSYPNETGGVFVGYLKEREKVLYIVDTYIPSNSRRGPTFFERGTDGVYEYIEKIYNKTGGQLRYAGEWHTHPNGSINMSPIDCNTLKMIKNELGESLLSHILIYNGKDIASYII